LIALNALRYSLVTTVHFPMRLTMVYM